MRVENKHFVAFGLGQGFGFGFGSGLGLPPKHFIVMERHKIMERKKGGDKTRRQTMPDQIRPDQTRQKAKPERTTQKTRHKKKTYPFPYP
jgi:hypothetical protein